MPNRPTTQPTTDARRRVAELHAAGLTVRNIAAVLGVSTQRVYQQLAALELPTPTRNGANQ